MHVKLNLLDKDGQVEKVLEGYVELQNPELYRLALIAFSAHLLGVGRLTPGESVKQAQIALEAFSKLPLPTGRHPYGTFKKGPSDGNDETQG